MSTDFNALVEKYKKKNKYSNSGTVTVQSSVNSKEEEEFLNLVEKYKQNDVSHRINTQAESGSTTRTHVWDKLDEEDIGPVKEAEDESLLDFFQKGSFKDGFDWHDIPTAILGTAGDAALGVTKGFFGLSEGIGDVLSYGVAGVADLVGGDRFAEGVRDFAQRNVVEEITSGADKYLNQYSVLGRTSDAVAQGIGQVAGIIATGGIGAAAGLGAAGTTALTTGVMGLSGMGSGMSEAYKGGATDEEALKYGAAAGASDALWELLFGGMGKAINAVGFSKGLSSLDDIVAKGVTKAVSNPNVRNILEFAVKSGFEGLEEVGSGFTQAVAKKLTYMSEEEFGEILKDENLLEQFIVGAATSGITQSGALPGMQNGSLMEANKTGRDFITGYSQNEQAVIDKEIENRIAEQEKDGKKLTNKEKSDIAARVEADMEKGYISTDTIEEALGGDSFKAYQDTVKAEDDLVKQEKTLTEEYNKLNKMVNEKMTGEQQVRRDELRTLLPELRTKIEDQKKNSQRDQLKSKLSEEVKNLVQGDRLVESYNEIARREQAFEADLNQYDDPNAKKTVENFMGVVNNTNKAHAVVDFLAKVSKDTGQVFKAADAKKFGETALAIKRTKTLEADGTTAEFSIGSSDISTEFKPVVTVNSKVVDNFTVDYKTGKITFDAAPTGEVKVEFRKNAIVNGNIANGEITVDIRSKKYLESIVGHEVTHVLEKTDFYKPLQEAIFEYAKSKGEYETRLKKLQDLYNGVEGANVEAELTADLVGDYLFQDSDFINKLSTENRNVFQKVYDEIKHLLKLATAGSDQARKLEQVKYKFDQAWQDLGKAQKNTASGGAKYSLTAYSEQQKQNWATSKRIVIYDNPQQLSQFIQDSIANKTMDKKMYFGAIPSDLATRIESDTGVDVENYNLSLGSYEIRKILKDHGSEATESPRGQRAVGEDDFAHIVDVVLNPTSVTLSENTYMGKPAIVFTGEYNGRMNVVAVVSDKRLDLFVQTVYVNTKKGNLAMPTGEQAPVNTLEANNGTVSNNNVAQKEENVNEKFSLSDTSGRQLSKEQAEYLKDSKVRDENGNLKVMYHGTPNGGFTVFKDGTYFTDNKEYADRYQNPGASSISTGKTATNPKTFEVYLDIKKPFDLNDAEARRIYIEDYIKGGNAMGINPYLSDAEYAKINTIDWTEGEDLRDFLTENGYDYDGLVLDEGADGGYGDEVQSRGTSYVVFSPEQVKSVDNQTPTSDPDIRFSLSETENAPVKSYAEITEEQQILYQRENRLREQKREAANNPDLLQAMDDYAALFTEMRGLLPKRLNGTASQEELDRIREIKVLREERMKQVTDLQESLGLNAIAEEEAKIRETKEALRLAADAAWAREGAEKENKAIEKAGVPAEEYFRKKALKAFKTTTNFNEAGYMLPDGKLLNFSGGERNHRYRDHREIGEIYEATQGAAALNRFMRDGNIRIMAESPGIDLTSGVEPTKEQYAALRKFININGVVEGQFFVDFSGAEGENVGKYAYNGRISAERIINDIKYFFQNGKVRESSGLLDFLSLSANEAKYKRYGDRATLGSEIAYAPETQLAAENSTPNSTDEDSSVAPVAISETETTTEDLFPDDTAQIQEEYEFLQAEREDIRGAMDAFAAVGNYDGAEQLMAEYEAVQKRIAEIEADDTARFASIDEADAPPEIENDSELDSEPEDVADNVPLTKVLVTELAKQVKGQLGLGNNRTAEVRELIERYSNEEFPSRAHLYTEIQERFGKYTEATVDEDLKQVKSKLRTYGINVDESIKGEIADYGQLMRSNFGKIRFAKDGLPVDVAYKEFQEVLPGYFPESIYVPTDQLMRIIEVANMDTTMENEYEIDWQTLEDVTDTIMNGVAEFKQNRKETLANRHGRESFNSLMEEADQFVPPIPENVAPVRPAIQNVQADPDDIAPVFDTSSGQQALMPEEEAPKETTRAEQRRNKQESYTKMWESMIGDTSTWKDMPIGLQYKTKTLRRILRKVVKDASGNPDFLTADRIYNELETKYDHNEALLKRESQKLKEVFFDLKLNHVEDTYAHMLGELRHNPDTTLTEDVVKEYYNKHKGKINTQKVNKAIVEARKTFDDLIVRVNTVLKEQGMREIPYRKGYFPHFTQPKQGFLGKLLNWKTIDTEVPTSIAGLTEAFKPQRSWQSFNKQRMGDTTDYSLYQGLDTYIHGALDWIYHVEDLQKRRALENYIRYTHSNEGVKARIQEIKAGDFDADEAQAMIDAVLEEADNPLSGLVRELMNRTNTLANKKSSMDRNMEDATNRKIYSTMTNLNNRINANMVVGSFSAALTNFIPIVQSWHQVSPVFTVIGLKDFIRSTIVDDGMVAKSDFLTNRLVEEENLYQTGWDKVTDKVAFLMNAIDNITAQTVWRSKYLQNLKEGMSEKQAITDADQFAKNVIAGRSRGNSPSIFDAKNPFVKIFTAFQLEVANQYGFMFEDTPQDSKNKVRLVNGYAKAFLGAYFYNALYSSLVGRDAAFDPVGIIEDLLKDLFGGDDDEEEEVNLADSLLDFGEDIVQQIPFVGSLLGGGRVPMSAAFPYSNDTTPVSSFMSDLEAGWNEGDPFKGDWSALTKEVLKPLYYLAMPVGGGQLKKTVEGLKMFDDDLPIAGSYTDSGNLRFPVEDTVGNRAQAALFGQWASENARDYFDNERKPLKEKQIQEFIDSDLPIRDYWDYREGLAEHEKLEDKVDYIAGLDLPISTKNMLINNVSDRKNPIDLTGYDEFATYEEFDFASKNPKKYDFLQEHNISYAQYTFSDGDKDFYDSVYEWVDNNPEKVTVSKAVTDNVVMYRNYARQLDKIRADKDSNGKSISGSAKEKKWNYINGLDIDYGAKLILFKNEYNADDTYNYEIVDYLNGRGDMTYDEKVIVLKELGFDVDAEGNISW